MTSPLIDLLVSFLSLRQIFEKLLVKRLRSNADLSAVLPDYQFGFRAGHSTIHQTHRIIHETAKSLEGKRLCTAVFLDVTQAFNKVWHTGLLYKIKTTLPSPYYLLLKSYLNTRFFQVKYNGSYSTCHEVLSGIPTRKCLRTLALLNIHCRSAHNRSHHHRHLCGRHRAACGPF